ncbi:MAG: hypothetical protein WA632_04055 [Gallionella sp.]
MRKSIISPVNPETSEVDQEWLNIEDLAVVEITSEDLNHPIESAFQPGQSGWRASGSGQQVIRLRFDSPQNIKRIRIHFVEPTAERTQEFVLRWSADEEQSSREIVRQQWNFSPSGATSEVEELHVALSAVRLLELVITPDISGGNACASLENFQFA